MTSIPSSVEAAPWHSRPLSECLEKVDVPRKIPKNRFLPQGRVPVISQEAEFINGYWNDEEDSVKVDRPVVIFGDHTQVLKLVDFDFVVGADGVKILNPKHFLDPSFLKYFLEANPVKSLGYARHYRHISGLPIPVPPLDEQKRIVAVLDQAFAALDRARGNVEVNLTEAAKVPETWLQWLFDGCESWPTHALVDACENLDRLRVPITKGEREPGDVPYYGASGVVDHVKGHLFDEDLLLVSEDGANLLARTYPIAFSISGKAWVNNHAHVLRFNDAMTQEFVRLYLNSISLRPYVTGMAQPKLNQAALNGIPVPMPSPEVREKIVRKAHQISGEAERAAGFYRAQHEDIETLRQSLLQAAFSGKLT